MVFRRRKRKFRGRRRFKKRRRGNTSAAYRRYIDISKRQNGVRRFHEEVRNFGMESVQNFVHWEMIAPEGHTDRIQSIIAKDTTLSGNPLGSSAFDRSKKSLIMNYKSISHFRNLSTHPVFVQIFEVTPRKDGVVETTLTSMALKLASDLAIGFEDYTGAGTSSTSVQSGKADTDFTPGDLFFKTSSVFRSPRGNKRFMKNWRITRNKLFKLEPGDDIFWTTRLKDRVYNPIAELQVAGAAERSWVKGYSKCLVVKFYGAIGLSTGADAHDVIGLMNSHLSVDRFVKCRVVDLVRGTHDLDVTVATDVLTSLTLEGPNEHVLASEAA